MSTTSILPRIPADATLASHAPADRVDSTLRFAASTLTEAQIDAATFSVAGAIVAARRDGEDETALRDALGIISRVQIDFRIAVGAHDPAKTA